MALKLGTLAAPVMLTHELGYFADEGLQVDIQQLAGSREGIPLLAAGHVDVAFFGLSAALLNAIGGGARVRIVAGRHRYPTDCDDGSTLLGSRRAFPDGFRDLGQLRGRRVSVSSLSMNSGYILDAALGAARLTRDDVEIVINPENRGVAMLAAGEVDVLAIGDSLRLQQPALADRIVTGPSIGTFLPHQTNSFAVYGARLLDGDLAIGTRVLRALVRGSRAFAGGKSPRFLDNLLRESGHDAAAGQLSCRSGFTVDGRFHAEDVQQFIDWSVRHALSPAMRAEEIVDWRFLDRMDTASGLASDGARR